MSKALVSATATVSAQSTARSLSIVTGTPVPATPADASAAQTAVMFKPTLPPLRYAAAVLKGQSDMLESVAPGFVGEHAKISTHEEGWILESSEFASCTTGEQVFGVADDIVSRVHRILALYCGMTETLSVEHIYWIDAEGEKRRTIRGSLPVNVVSSRGLAELKTMNGAQPLGSAICRAMVLNSGVNEALALHGEGELGWPQVYDIIEFLGGEAGIVKAGYANREQIRTVRQTANHHRHLGSPKKYLLPSHPPTLNEASEFVRSLLKWWISSRL